MLANNIVHRTWRFALVLALLIGFLLPVTGSVHADTVITNPTLPTTFAWPSWWSGTWGTNDCNGSVYNATYPNTPASVLSTWRGIQACGPKPKDLNGQDLLETMPNSGASQYMFECTELAARYLQTAYGIKSLVANGGQFAYNYGHDSTWGSKFAYYVNGTDNVLPQEGDVVSMTSSSDANGHVAIVTGLSVSDTDPTSGTITLMDQNGSSSGTFSMTISDYVIQDNTDLGLSATDWIHPLVGIDNNPSVTLSTEIQTIVARNRTQAWIAGNEQPVGYDKRPVTYYYNGSSWIKYWPPSQGSYQHHYLYDIAIGTDGKVWAVGYYYNYPWSTLVYRLDMTQQTWSWTKVNSQNGGLSSSSNYLYGVDTDGLGNIFAVGYYNNSVNYPLIEKWNGSTFVNQGVSLPSGVTSGTLSDVSFSSSSNGWAVGSVGGYVYHYDGSSWTPVALPTGALAIQHVAAVSDDEAWGDSYYYQNSVWASHLFHYTTANGWQEDTSFTFPSGTSLNNIDSDGSNVVWAVGSYAVGGSPGQPYLMRYDGTAWHQVTSNTYGYPTGLQDVSLYGGYVWATGIRTSTSAWGAPFYPLVIVK